MIWYSFSYYRLLCYPKMTFLLTLFWCEIALWLLGLHLALNPHWPLCLSLWPFFLQNNYQPLFFFKIFPKAFSSSQPLPSIPSYMTISPGQGSQCKDVWPRFHGVASLYVARSRLWQMALLPKGQHPFFSVYRNEVFLEVLFCLQNPEPEFCPDSMCFSSEKLRYEFERRSLFWLRRVAFGSSAYFLFIFADIQMPLFSCSRVHC